MFFRNYRFLGSFSILVSTVLQGRRESRSSVIKIPSGGPLLSVCALSALSLPLPEATHLSSPTPFLSFYLVVPGVRMKIRVERPWLGPAHRGPEGRPGGLAGPGRQARGSGRAARAGRERTQRLPRFLRGRPGPFPAIPPSPTPLPRDGPPSQGAGPPVPDTPPPGL